MDTWYLLAEITDGFEYWVGYDFDVHWTLLVLQGGGIYSQGQMSLSLWVPADVDFVARFQSLKLSVFQAKSSLIKNCFAW